MACEFSSNAVQTVNPGESVIFTTTEVACTRGYVRHRNNTGNFLLAGSRNNYCQCGGVRYLVDFGANIAIPTGGTVGEISLAFAIDGSTIPASTMSVTPAAVEEYFNVSRSSSVDIFAGCCETVSVRNISDQPIVVQNATLRISR